MKKFFCILSVLLTANLLCATNILAQSSQDYSKSRSGGWYCDNDTISTCENGNNLGSCVKKQGPNGLEMVCTCQVICSKTLK